MYDGSIITISSSSEIRRRTSAPRIEVCSSIASLNCVSMFRTGLSEFMLLWNTVDMSRHRSGRSADWLAVVMSLPANTMLPPAIRPGGGSSRRSALPSVVLPLPDSPSRPTNSPSWIWNETSRTARVAP